jgi:CRP-like cAMP-binding protein
MISADIVVDTIGGHEWVQGLSKHHIEKLAKLGEERYFDPGEVLFAGGDLADFFYVIVSGTVAMTLPLRANSLIAQVIIPSQEIGWDAFIEGGVRCFTAKTMTPVRALLFNGRELLAACERDPQFGFLLMKHLLGVVSERLDASQLLLLIRS